MNESKLKFSYVLTRKDVKRINCRIKSDGIVYVSANKKVSIKTIEDFLYEKQNFILDSIEKIQLTQKKNKIGIDLENLQVTLLNTTYKVYIIEDKKDFVKIQDDLIFIYTVDINNNKRIEKIFDLFLQDWFKYIITPICEHYFSLLKNDYTFIKYPDIYFKKYKSMWGNCNPKLGIIKFNTNLAYTNINFVKYVVLHEFTHLIHANHQKEFYDLLKQYMPNYKEVKRSIN